MNRLTTQWNRLYAPAPASDETGLVSADGRVRAFVLSLARPANWDELATVWRGVQEDFGWPAPAITVSGTDAFQLWFSLAEAVPVAQAHETVSALSRHYLPDVAPKRLQWLPTLQAVHAAPIPAQQETSGNWSAFVAPDLAPVFTDTPWLDIPPTPDGQADLLTALQPIAPAALAEARMRLSAGAPAGAASAHGPVPHHEVFDDPKRFLLRVMNDPGVPMALRIDAARALLPHAPQD